MSAPIRHALPLAALVGAAAAIAAGADLGQAAKQATNWTAISMFAIFVVFTLFITKWAAAKTKSAADFYTGGGGITGFQNGLAIAGDYMSAASFLGISAAVMVSGFDGLIFSIGFLVGWPIVTFLLAERLRNLGKFTFADVVSFRFAQTPVRIFAASGTLVVVAFYLIAQMVGAGQLIKLLFGLEYWIAVVIVGGLMMVYVLFGGMTATTWVQIIKAVLLLCGASFMAFMVLLHFNFSPEAMFAQAVQIKTDIAAKGGQLRALHLMQPEAIGATPYPFKGEGDGMVAKPHFGAGPGGEGKVHINATQWFDAVPQLSWEFHIGGYQPAQKWLKDRKGRELSFEDVKHWQAIIKILSETHRIMQTITMELDTGARAAP